ncbi:MAG: hypothetical protein IKL65_02910, partial [Bacilli bacterium]|nr:hypothetical protein [Bacilli bacterium]
VAANPSNLGDPATIDNSSNPTISGLNAKFTAPNQSVTYTFYARNTGEFLAYLNYITFTNVEGTNSNKVCTASDGTSQALVDQACNGISMSVKVGTLEAVSTSQSSIQNHTLATNTSEVVTVTISYAENAALADGAFNVSFGDVSLIYSSINDYVAPETPEETTPVCTLTDNDSDGVASLSDVVTCGTENFYVMDNKNNEVTMLSMYNLNVGDNVYPDAPIGIQNENVFGWKEGYEQYGSVGFSTTLYWDSSSYSKFVFGESSDIIYPYVTSYERYLKETVKVTSAIATLVSYEQLEDLNCTGSTCSNEPSWVYSTSYWTGSADNSNLVWRVLSFGMLGGASPNDNSDAGMGVRPVVTISTSEIG